jgi:hypothetical protein
VRASAWKVADAFEYALNCHCSRCRRATGTAFKALAGIEIGKLTLIRGEEVLLRYGDPGGHDVRCGVCGSLLYSVVREARYAHVAMGSLMDSPTLRPTRHIFVGSKAPWFEITDSLPQFNEFSGS